MADDETSSWVEVPASAVAAGDRVRHRDAEFVVARVDPRFLGRDNMIWSSSIGGAPWGR